MRCTKCNSDLIVKNGKRKNGDQEYKCKKCSCRFTGKEKYRTLTDDKLNLIYQMYHNKTELRKIARTLGIALSTVQYHLKKRFKI